jgi:hypothetical protein
MRKKIYNWLQQVLLAMIEHRQRQAEQYLSCLVKY